MAAIDPDETPEHEDGVDPSRPRATLKIIRPPPGLDLDEDDEDVHMKDTVGKAIDDSAAAEGDRQVADALRKAREQDRAKGKAVDKQIVRRQPSCRLIVADGQRRSTDPMG